MLILSNHGNTNGVSMHISFQLCLQVGSLKQDVGKVFTPRKLADAINRVFSLQKTVVNCLSAHHWAPAI